MKSGKVCQNQDPHNMKHLMKLQKYAEYYSTITPSYLIKTSSKTGKLVPATKNYQCPRDLVQIQ